MTDLEKVKALLDELKIDYYISEDIYPEELSIMLQEPYFDFNKETGKFIGN